MANRLKMAEHQAILGLYRLKWSQRRIAAELGVDRETVSRHIKSSRADPPGASPPDPNAAIVITGSEASARADEANPNATILIIGSEGPEPAITESQANATIVITGSEQLPVAFPGRQSYCEPWREIIIQSLEQGLTARRIWQDLKSESGLDRKSVV